MGSGAGKRFSKVLLSFFLAMAFSNVSGERILFLLPLSINSHKIFFEPLINGLAAKGHEVTVLTNGVSNSSVGNTTVVELVTVQKEDFMMGYPDPFENMKIGGRKLAFPFNFILNGCHKVIQSQTFQDVMRGTEQFDLIMVDSFLSGCLDGFVYKSGVPFILVTTMPAPSYISERVGNFLPPSIIPVMSFGGYEESNGQMSFWSRLRNFVHFILARVYVNLVILPSLENVYREYLGDDIPGIMEIESKASMIFMNSHFSMNFPRPLLPATVEISGIHCGKAKIIPLRNSALEKFISKAASPHGFIYFSLGSIIKLHNAPDAFIKALLATFSRLEQRVVLKWKMRKGNRVPLNMTKAIFQIPKNVLAIEWLDQQDILGHENIRLFISHGGLLSMQEAVYSGVPVLGIPFGLDQDTNLYNAVLQGYALKLNANELDEETLSSSINKVLSNQSYHENAQRISKLFRQRPISPLETAIFWTEYVMSIHKSNSSHFIQSPARNMSIFQYYSCDILAFLTIFLIFASFIMRKMIKLLQMRITRISIVNYSGCHKKVE